MGYEYYGKIASLLPEDESGFHFVAYGDSCVSSTFSPNEVRFGKLNAAIRRLSHRPQFICFLGDHITGYTDNYDDLRQQWQTWLNRAMAWVDTSVMPIYHITGNHNTYDEKSEAVWRETFPDIPLNGPEEQQGFSYFHRQDDLLLVFVNTSFTGLGGKGHVEHIWLEQVLNENRDARHKLVIGHYPIHPVNGYEEYPQWRVCPEDGKPFWDILVRHEVKAYLCAHIIAFDVQVHQGVLQIMSAGAGARFGIQDFMPGPAFEYHHFMQMAVDRTAVRIQTIDMEGQIREKLTWPPPETLDVPWQNLPEETPQKELVSQTEMLEFRINAVLETEKKADQTLVCGWGWWDTIGPADIWIGIERGTNRLVMRMVPKAGWGTQQWWGPVLPANTPINGHLALHRGMGPGGVLWCDRNKTDNWTSLFSYSPWGAEQLIGSDKWSVGHGASGSMDKPFLGSSLSVQFRQHFELANTAK